MEEILWTDQTGGRITSGKWPLILISLGLKRSSSVTFVIPQLDNSATVARSVCVWVALENTWTVSRP